MLMGKETSQLTEKEALSIYARMMHTLDSSEFESFLSQSSSLINFYFHQSLFLLPKYSLCSSCNC